MTILMSCLNITKSYGATEVLKGISLDITAGDRIGLAGRNGAGKSTLAKIIAGNLDMDTGQIKQFRKNMLVRYMGQDHVVEEELLLEEHQRDSDDSRLMGILGVDSLLKDASRLESMSGGERVRFALATIWNSNPDLLILDEPTNHMDLDGISWLIESLRRFNGAVIIISHDRYFLDQTVNEIWEVEQGRLTAYKGNYSCYAQAKKKQYESQLHNYEAQEKEQRRIESAIDQLKNWSATAHRESREKPRASGNLMGGKEYYRAKAMKKDKAIKSQIKRLEKMQKQGVERPKAEASVNFSYEEAGKRGKRLLQVSDITHSFGSRLLFGASSFYVNRGEKVGIYGPNGCGKTTLIKLLLDKIPLQEGELFLSPSLRIAYINQSSWEFDPAETVLQGIAPTQLNEVIYLLIKMGFTQDMMCRSIGELSPGERTRLNIARSIMQKPDLLVLDEPTNHLDLPSREQLEETLCSYDGTLLLVTHDRYMLERVCDCCLLFKDQVIRRYEGNFSESWVAPQETEKKNPQSLIDPAERLQLDTRISYLLGELSRFKPGQAEYDRIDKELTALMAVKSQKLSK